MLGGVAAMPVGVIGRDAELASLDAFLATLPGGPAAVVLEGEAGVGKTTLWLAALDAAPAGTRTLGTRPAHAEAEMSYAGVGDLLDGVLDEALDELPAPQGRALSRALLLEGEDAPADYRAVGVAVLGLLRVLSRDGPVLIAVDDVQWLDPASAAVLLYAGRRLREEPVGVLVARRKGTSSPVPEELSRSLPSGRFQRVDVGPLGVADLHRVISHHLGLALPRPLLRQVCEQSGGNPFFALEIARTLAREGALIRAGSPLPVPAPLNELMQRRLSALSADCREWVLAAAAMSQPTISVVREATGTDPASGLQAALEADVLELDGDRIRFTHPLLAASAYDAADPIRRADLHARLARAVDDPEERARHLAASVHGADESVAAALEDAARGAEARAAPHTAARLLEQAHALTPPERVGDAARRAVDAAFFHFESGDSVRAASLLDDVIAGLPAGLERARALTRLARVRSYGEQDVGARLFRQAIAEAEDDRAVLAVAHAGVADCLFRLRVQVDDAVDHARIASRLAVDLGDEPLAAETLASLLTAEALLGRESAAETASLALARQHAADGRRVIGQPLAMLAVYWWWTDELALARETLIQLLERTHDLGDESSRPYILILLGQVECQLGELESAAERAREGLDVAEQAGQSTVLAYHLALESLANAYRGREAATRASALRALELVPATGGRPAEILAASALGHLALALGDPAEATRWLSPIVAHAQTENFGEPGAVRFVGDQIEALIELGRQEEAVAVLDWYEGNARRLRRASALATCSRCRGLLAAVAGDDVAAMAALGQSLALLDGLPFRLERARSLLTIGAVHRRRKRKSAARAALGEAVAEFDAIGAAAWAERAADELRRISGRAPSAEGLTPTEQRVAALVVDGKTNREVAAALFLSNRTVEGHLSHIYAKLGVRSRTELARAMPLPRQPVS